MPLQPNRPPVPSFDEHIENGGEMGKKIADHLIEAEKRVKEGLDPMPLYEEADHIFKKE